MTDVNARPDGSVCRVVSLDFDATGTWPILKLPDTLWYYIPERESRLKRFLRRLFRREPPQRLVGRYKPTKIGVALSDEVIEIKIDADQII